MESQNNSLHLVLSNADGEPLDAEKKELGPLAYQQYLRAMFESIKAKDPTGDPRKKKILIHVHGGLNTLGSSLSRAQDLVPKIQDAGFYPILFGWRSGPFLSYFEHLFVIRQGRKRIPRAVLTWPFVLFADLGRGLTRAPLVIWRQLMTAARAISARFSNDARNTTALFVALRRKHEEDRPTADNELAKPQMACGAIAVSKGEDSRGPIDRTVRAVSYVLTFVLLFKPILAILVDGFGKAAWENMLRRTKVVFRTPSEFDIKSVRKDPSKVDEAACAQARGAMSGLFRELTDFINPDGKSNPFDSEYEITLVGHSMGAIIMNQAVKEFPDLPYKNIVYMAAACSIREFVDSVVPYVSRHEESRVYNLCLHPVADAREIAHGFIDVLPRGSLLEWIDNLFTTPHGLLDRTLGKWENIIQATHVIPERLRDRVTIKAFGVGGPAKPQRHGQFNDIEFWDDRVLEAL